MHDATLCYFLSGEQVLLSLKKTSFGHGRWNGYGGKVKDESLEQAARREAKEECGLDAHHLDLVARFEYHFPHAPAGKRWDQIVSVYLCKEWSGTPCESEEMGSPTWFPKDGLPFDQMWENDRLWLPRLLAGEVLKGRFVFSPDNATVKEYVLSRVDS